MDNRVTMYPNFAAEHRSSASDNPACGDEELDEETANFITALYAALGPLLPEVSKLQGHQDPPAHLMVDMKAKLRELGSSVSDARKKLLRYNIYLKKKLAKAVQERRALRDQHVTVQPGPEQPSPTHMQRGLRMDMDPGKVSLGTEKNIQEFASPDFGKIKPLDRVHRRSDMMDERPRTPMTPLGILQKTNCMPPHPPL